MSVLARKKGKQLWMSRLFIWREFPEMLYKHLFDIVDLDEGTKDRVPSGLRGLQRRQRPRDELTARDT